MKRALEIISGIGVLLTALLSSAAVFKMAIYYQQSSQRVPLVSAISLGVTGLAVLLSFIGAFILLSWANKPK
jgi:amino acid permease